MDKGYILQRPTFLHTTGKPVREERSYAPALSPL